MESTMKTLSKPIAILLMAYLVDTAANAQVTIGSRIEPTKGALLDLKEQTSGGDKITSTKGLLFPRVNLTNLKPVNPTGDNSLPASIGSLASESWDLEAHIGLMVYNVNKCAGSEQIAEGSYVWMGTEWEYLGKESASGMQYHPAKPGVYEEFYSAEFGDAGRWMTTNLTAWAYDENIHSQNYSLTQSANNSNSLPYWSYPNGRAGGSDATSYTANPHLGLLYNWSAATAGKGGSTGTENNVNEGGDSTSVRVQGICPQGWHLPSDWEWTELENEIIKHTTSYASVSSDVGSPLLPLDDKTTTGWRGSTHGNAMKSPCPVPLSTIATNGLSETVRQNGFEVLLAGIANDGSTGLYNGNGFFWSASSFSAFNAWYRTVSGSFSQVHRNHSERRFLLSVRCKKD